MFNRICSYHWNKIVPLEQMEQTVPLEQLLEFVQLDPILPLEQKIVPLE